MDLKTQFQESLWHYEFYCYDIDEETNTISLESFLKSITVCLPADKINKYFRQIDKLIKNNPEEFEKRVSLEEFILFQHFLDNMDEIKAAIYSYKYIKFEKFQKAIHKFSKFSNYAKKNKVEISDAQINALFMFLDLDGNRELEQQEFIGVLNERKQLGQGREQVAMDEISKSVVQLKKWLKDEIGISF